MQVFVLRGRTVVDGGRQLNGLVLTKGEPSMLAPELFPTQTFSQDIVLLVDHWTCLFPTRPLLPSPTSPSLRTKGNVNPWLDHCNPSTGRCVFIRATSRPCTLCHTNCWSNNDCSSANSCTLYGVALGSATQKRVVGGVSGRMGGIEGLGGGSIISFVLILPIC